MEKHSYYSSSNLDKAITFIAKLHYVTVYFPEEWYAKSGIPLEAEEGGKSTGPYWGGVTWWQFVLPEAFAVSFIVGGVDEIDIKY